MALSAGLPLLQPVRIEEVIGQIGEHDALAVAAYGQILRSETLNATEHGAWNVHASLLPAYRGAAPIERAIMNGERETGVSIMLMDEGLDTGPVALQEKTPIEPDDNAGNLAQKLASRGSKAMVEVLSLIERGSVTLTDQDESKATYAAKISNEDRTLRWGLPARKIHDQIRALAPQIGARVLHPAFAGPVKILRSRVADEEVTPEETGTPIGVIMAAKESILVQCGKGVLRVEELQAPGGKPLTAGEFLRGNSLDGAFIES